MKMGQSVPKRRHITFRRRGITQKKTYNELEVISFSVIFVTFVTYLLSSFTQLIGRTTTVSTYYASISLLNTLYGSRSLCIGVVIETFAGKRQCLQ